MNEDSSGYLLGIAAGVPGLNLGPVGSGGGGCFYLMLLIITIALIAIPVATVVRAALG